MTNRVAHQEISKKNKYWIEKNRYNELKYFCLQYPIWREAYNSLSSLSKRPSDLEIFTKNTSNISPTEKCAEARLKYKNLMSKIEQSALETDNELHSYILIAVTEGLSFETLKLKHNIPCGRRKYYELYRLFFYILNKRRE